MSYYLCESKFLGGSKHVLGREACSITTKSLLQRQTRLIISIDICGANTLAISDWRPRHILYYKARGTQKVHTTQIATNIPERFFFC